MTGRPSPSMGNSQVEKPYMVPTKQEKVFLSLLHHGCHLSTHGVTNSSLFAQDFPGFSTESPMSQELYQATWTLLSWGTPRSLWVYYFLGTQSRSGSKSQVLVESSGLFPLPILSPFPCLQKHPPSPCLNQDTSRIWAYVFTSDRKNTQFKWPLPSSQWKYLRHRSPRSLLQMNMKTHERTALLHIGLF